MAHGAAHDTQCREALIDGAFNLIASEVREYNRLTNMYILTIVSEVSQILARKKK